MGFTAIWISPVRPRYCKADEKIVKNVPPSVTYGSGEAYHGYWAEDLYSVNPYFGNGSDLLALSHALHARKMLLMVDVAPNHMGSGAADATKYNNYIPWADEHYFHPPNFNITYSPPNQTEIETFWIGGPDGVSLPDVNTELPEVYNTLYLWIRQLVETYAVDGLRLDTVKHIRKSFWQQFCKSSGVFAIGEVLDGGFEYNHFSSQLILATWDRTRTSSQDC
jgi:alpha-amylase